MQSTNQFHMPALTRRQRGRLYMMSRTAVLVSIPLSKNVCEVLILSTWQVMALKCVWFGLMLVDIFHFAHLTVRSDRRSPFQAPTGLAFLSISTGSLSHSRTSLPKSSSQPLPAQQPNHAAQSLHDSKSLYAFAFVRSNIMYWDGQKKSVKGWW